MTTTEIKILKILWEKGRPMCASEILEENPDIKEITLRTTIKKMLDKDYIKVDGMTQRYKNFARTFVPNIKEEEVYMEELGKVSGSNPFDYICTLLKHNRMSEEQYDVLKSIIDERSDK